MADPDLLRMPSSPQVLGNSSEEEFLHYLGLDMRRRTDRERYQIMKADMRRAHQRICEDRSNLLPYLQKDRSVRPPFVTTEITEGALQREIQRIYAESRGEVRTVYQLGINEKGRGNENWVIRWLLWRAFVSFGDEDEDDEDDDDDDEQPSHTSPGQTSTYWDPARN